MKNHGSEKFAKYIKVLEYQKSLFTSPCLDYYKAFLQYRKLYYDASPKTAERKELYYSLMKYYNEMYNQTELWEEHNWIYVQDRIRLRDEVLYRLESERRAALRDLGYAEEEINILEKWLEKPSVEFL